MGTAVLFPQDCLRPRSRHKHQTSGMIFPPECAPRSKRSPPTPAQSQEAGLLPLPGHGRHSSPMNIPRRRSDANHFKPRKCVEQRDIYPSPRMVSDAPVYKILQRPKQGDDSVSLLAQFMMLDDTKSRSVMVVAPTKKGQGDDLDGADKHNSPVKAEFGTSDLTRDGFKYKSRGSETKLVKVFNEGGSVCQLKDVSKFSNGVRTSSDEGNKFPGMKVGALKSKNVRMEKVQSGPDDSVRPAPPRVAPKPSMIKAAGKVNDTSCKALIAQCSEESNNMLPRLRRASTEPQISAHVLGQYRSKVMHISFDNANTESYVHGRGFSDNTTSLSCPERWAGPAYTASPSPSSLPLPKLCLPHTRFSSLDIPPLVKHYSTGVYMEPFLGSSAPSKNGGAWDVAFATKSLRKMLNLDPC